MALEDMSMKELLALHNQKADKPAGPKSFATKGKLIARIEVLNVKESLNLALSGQVIEVEASKQRIEAPADVVEKPSITTKTTLADTAPKSGKGVGELARHLIMDVRGFSHEQIAEMVRAQIPGSNTTAKSVRWYACKMRKEGLEIPKRKPALKAGPHWEGKTNFAIGIPPKTRPAK